MEVNAFNRFFHDELQGMNETLPTGYSSKADLLHQRSTLNLQCEAEREVRDTATGIETWEIKCVPMTHMRPCTVAEPEAVRPWGSFMQLQRQA
jgi:hypothetical protein